MVEAGGVDRPSLWRAMIVTPNMWLRGLIGRVSFAARSATLFGRRTPPLVVRRRGSAPHNCMAAVAHQVWAVLVACLATAEGEVPRRGRALRVPHTSVVA